jgi:outer membrane protein assembly factor BamB
MRLSGILCAEEGIESLLCILFFERRITFMRTFFQQRAVKIGSAILAEVLLLSAVIGGFVLSRANANAATPYLPPLVFGTTGQGRIYAVNGWKQQVAWVDYGRNGYKYYGTPILANGFLYVSASDENVYAFTERTNRQIWHTKEGYTTLFGASDGDVYGSNSVSFFALDANTGQQLWKILEPSSNYNY